MNYPLFRELNPQNNTLEENALRSNTGQNKLTNLYFSQMNVHGLQEAIRYQVYVRSGNKHVIGKQSEDELKVVMRSVYLEYGRNVPYDIITQVKELNGRVIEYCVDNILSEINMYMYYLEDISTMPQPLARPETTTSAGSKTLIMKEF